MMQVIGVKADVFKGRRSEEKKAESLANESLENYLVRHLAHHELEGSVVAITSKVVSLDEGQTVPLNAISKKDLIRKEADHYLADGPFDVALTIKHGIMIPSAGIDESNSPNGDYILFPKKPFESARRLNVALRQRFGLQKLGVLLTDSHTQPLRKGVTGVALAYWGFKGVRSHVGDRDLFEREMRYTSVNVADALAASAVYVMGETAESTPIAIIKGAGVDFVEEVDPAEVSMDPKEDLYYTLYQRK